MEATQRMIPLEGGKRSGVKLDEATWQAIDWLAEQDGETWQRWCGKVIAATPETENATAAVRAAAMASLLDATVFQDRGTQLLVMEQHPLMRDSVTLNDSQFEEVMSSATVQGSTDFGGFVVLFGHDQYGQDCIWVKNGLRNGLHFAFVLPNKEEGGK